MGTEYKVFEDKESKIEISLYEMSCQFYICASVPIADREDESDRCSATTDKKYTEDEIVEMAASLIGPLYYHSDKPELILTKLYDRLKKRGFT